MLLLLCRLLLLLLHFVAVAVVVFESRVDEEPRVLARQQHEFTVQREHVFEGDVLGLRDQVVGVHFPQAVGETLDVGMIVPDERQVVDVLVPGSVKEDVEDVKFFPQERVQQKDLRANPRRDRRSRGVRSHDVDWRGVGLPRYRHSSSSETARRQVQFARTGHKNKECSLAEIRSTWGLAGISARRVPATGWGS